jgi:hypothetical protein
MYSNILSILTQEVKCLLQYGETIDLFDVDLQAHWNAIIQKNLNISDCPHVKKECNRVRAPSFLFMGRRHVPAYPVQISSSTRTTNKVRMDGCRKWLVPGTTH